MLIHLTPYGLVMPYDDIDLGKHWPGYLLAAWCIKPLPEPILISHDVSKFLWHTSENNFTASSQATVVYDEYTSSLNHCHTSQWPVSYMHIVFSTWERTNFMGSVTCLCLTHIPLVPHICVGELGQHWFRYMYRLVACSAPSHCLNHCWLIVNWTPGNKFQWNLNRNYTIFI